MKTFIALSSLSMDLDRISMAIYRKSYETVGKFTREAQKRAGEINKEDVQPYIVKALENVKNIG